MAPKSVVMSCRLIPMHVIVLVLVGLLILQDGGLTVNAQGANAGQLFLDQKESQVKMIAANATLNDADCGILLNCRAECSRERCRPLSGESRQCVALPGSENHKICPREDVGCGKKMLLDYSRSYVTLAPGASATSLETEIARDVCLQRRLDSTFKAVSVPSNFSKVYFGSASGVFRMYPGSEGSDTQCTTYDSRRRPWYLQGISVSRDVKILVDVARSMDQLLTVDYKRPPGTSYLDVVKNMTLKLLETFSPGDNVEVFTFDATDATSLGGALAVIEPYNNLNPNPELAGLVTDVNALAALSVAGASDLNGAIRKAAASFNRVQSLKVIIVLSNGLFVVNSTSFPTAALQNYRAKLMVYKLPTNDDGGDPFLQRTPFQRDICSVQGSFELLDALATSNPLYSLRSYFTYLAGIQLIAAGGKVTWTNTYRDYSQLYSVVRPTFPAFGRDGLLLGVVGMDVAVDELAMPLRDQVWQELSRRTRAHSAPANLSMNCYYQTSIGPANWSCPPLDSSGICPQTDTSSTRAERACCGDCSTPSNPALLPITPNLPLVGFLGLALIAGLVGIFLIGCFLRKRYLIALRPQPVEEADPLVFYENIVIRLGKQKSKRNVFSEGRIFLNERQCMDLSAKLLKTIRNVREMISCCKAPADLFKPAVGKLCMELGKAKLLVKQCRSEDWYRTAVSQVHNEIAFQEILLDVGLCYNAIYEQVRSWPELERKLPEDLQESTMFMPASQVHVHKDQVELQKMLEKLASKRGESDEQWLARYLLERLKHPPHSNLQGCSTSLWMKEKLPTSMLGIMEFLRTGPYGVCNSKLLGIPCTKKVFHLSYPEQEFVQEARISAHLKHPCVVDFICCGNGVERGDRFIAMERMEMDLYELIEGRRRSDLNHFSLPVVMDIMAQIARGMCYLHGQGVAHRDLKPHNVVVKPLAPLDPKDDLDDHFEKHYCVKLVDFGTSKAEVEESELNDISKPNCGTTRYRAPEIHRGAYPDGVGRASWFKADAFSFAMTCAHMLTLQQPFGKLLLNEIYTRLVAGTRHELPADCPQELELLLKDCWNSNPTHRPPFEEILSRLEALRFKLFRGSSPQGKSHEFIQRNMDNYITRISQPEPLTSERNGTVATANEAIVISPAAPSNTEASISHSSIEMVQSYQNIEGAFHPIVLAMSSLTKGVATWTAPDVGPVTATTTARLLAFC